MVAPPSHTPISGKPGAVQHDTRHAQKAVRLKGRENVSLQRLPPDRSAICPVNSATRMLSETNQYIPQQPDREKAFAGASGGGGGIRTHGGLSPPTVFKTVAIDHSATPPGQRSPMRSNSILKELKCDGSPPSGFSKAKHAVNIGRGLFDHCPRIKITAMVSADLEQLAQRSRRVPFVRRRSIRIFCETQSAPVTAVASKIGWIR